MMRSSTNSLIRDKNTNDTVMARLNLELASIKAKTKHANKITANVPDIAGTKLGSSAINLQELAGALAILLKMESCFDPLDQLAITKVKNALLQIAYLSVDKFFEIRDRHPIIHFFDLKQRQLDNTPLYPFATKTFLAELKNKEKQKLNPNHTQRDVNSTLYRVFKDTSNKNLTPNDTSNTKEEIIKKSCIK